MNLKSQIATLIRNLSDDALFQLAVESGSIDVGTATMKAKPGPKPSNGAAAAPAATASQNGKRRGRPAGSKNKPKDAPAAAPVATAAPAAAAPAATADAAAAPAPAPAAAPAASEPVSIEVDKLSLDIEMWVRTHAGVSSGQVAEQFKIERPQAATILKKLVGAGKIFMAGERRFSRYAGDAKTAEDASAAAHGAPPAAE